MLLLPFNSHEAIITYPLSIPLFSLVDGNTYIQDVIKIK
jgi:hypothetical protein